MTRLILCAFFALFCAASATASSNQDRWFQLATNMMDPAHVEKLKELQCKVIPTNTTVDDGVARWKNAFLECENPSKETQTSIVICEEQCFDPNKCRILKKLKSFAILVEKPIHYFNEQGEEREALVNLPLACGCEPIKKQKNCQLKRKKGRKGKKRKNMKA